MSETSDTGAAPRPAWLPLFLCASIAANVFAIVAVNFWIYYARAAFIAAHPQQAALKPPTISRAISDPAIGAPFAVWVTVSAVLLVFGIFAIALVHARIAQGRPFQARRAGLWLLLFAASPVICQGVASAGMYLLSSYRFPDHNAIHMAGSHLFFIGQTLVIALSAVLCSALLRGRVALGRIRQLWGLPRGWFVLRAWAAWASVGAALVYMALFRVKDMDFGAANDGIYAAYVLLEPAVISSYLLVLAMFQADLWAAARARTSG